MHIVHTGRPRRGTRGAAAALLPASSSPYLFSLIFLLAVRPVRFLCTSQGDRAEARAYVARLLQIGCCAGVPTAALMYGGRFLLPAWFSQDAAVVALAASVLPLVCLVMVHAGPSFAFPLPEALPLQ